MFTASDVLPVIVLGVLAVLVALPRNQHTPDHVPDPPIQGEEPPEPLPTDQRAHLAFLADTSESADTRRRAIELLAVDDRRRGRDQGYRHREV